jgi:hypothetical protein
LLKSRLGISFPSAWPMASSVSRQTPNLGAAYEETN